MESIVEETEKSPLEKAQERMAEMRAQGFKPVILSPVEKALANPRSLKMAIRAHCWTCMGAGADAGVRQAVRDCTVAERCSLWPHRPWQNVTTSHAEIEDEEVEHEDATDGADVADADDGIDPDLIGA